MIKVVAFLQYPWYPVGTVPPAKNMYPTEQDFHRRMLEQTPAGWKLKCAFGDDLFKQIWWDNIGVVHTSNSYHPTKPDIKHVERVIKEQDPDLILVFGTLTKRVLDQSINAIGRKVMETMHPANGSCRQFDTDAFAYAVSEFVRTVKPIDINRKSKIV